MMPKLFLKGGDPITVKTLNGVVKGAYLSKSTKDWLGVSTTKTEKGDVWIPVTSIVMIKMGFTTKRRSSS